MMAKRKTIQPNQSDLVSVIMPIYNSEHYVEESIRSVLQQTYTNIELILINDGSTDKSFKIINSIKDKRIVIINKKINEGLVAALNDGIKVSQGEFIARMDNDDVMLNDRIEKQIFHLKKNNFDIVFSNAKSIGSSFSRKICYKILNDELPYLLMVDNPLVHPTMFAKSKILNEFSYDKCYEYCEDYHLWCSLVLRNIKIGVMDCYLIKYRLHGNQITQTKRALIRTKTMKLKDEYISSYFPNESLKTDYEKYTFIVDKTSRNTRILFFMMLYFDSDFSRDIKALTLCDSSNIVNLCNTLLFFLFKLKCVRSRFWNIKELVSIFRI